MTESIHGKPRINKTVLVVEDDFASKQYLLLLLKKLDYQVHSADSGEQALTLMKDKEVDLMLLDIALGPGISGIELGIILKKEKRLSKTPMIAVSAFSKDKFRKLKTAGFADYLAKPFTMNQLKTLLEQY
ncbi:MAG: response regulator [Candidatus Marinimicrobia bacterium]|nr:response regulator [Candidatus Neomarinimicrobiota bacterium]